MNKKDKESEKKITLNQSTATTKALIKISSATAYKVIKYGTHQLDLKFRFNKSELPLSAYKEMNLLCENEEEEDKNWEKIKWSDFRCTFSVQEFCKEMGITDGGKQRDEIRKMLEDVTSEKIVLQCKGRDIWFPWFIKAEYVYSDDKKNDSIKEQSISLRFNPGVIGAALVSKNEKNEQYAHQELLLIGKLNFYAMRIYDLVMAFYNKKGRYGNAPGTWKTDWYTVDYLKKFLQCEFSYIGRIDNFLQKALKNPIEEINTVSKELDINLKVNIEYERGGRGGKQIKHIRFVCAENAQELLFSKYDSEKEKREKREINKDNLEAEKLKNKYKDRWDEIVEQFLNLEENKNNAFIQHQDRNSSFFESSIIDYIQKNIEK